MSWCSTCERWVEKTTTHAVSPIGVSTISVERCPDCETILSIQSEPPSSGVPAVALLLRSVLDRLRDANGQT